MSYKPTFSQSLSLDGLKRWISSELVRISNAFIKNSQQTQITVSTEAPAKPQTGQVVFADGTIWNPSDGRGLYYYDTNTWQFFGSGGGGGGGGGSFTETNDLTASVSWTPVPDSYITQSSVTQHQSQLSISETQIHDLQSYLTAETDPIFSAHAASGITSTQILNWDTAYGWGNHSTQGYLTSHQDISGKADLDSSPTFTGTITAPNVDITHTGYASVTTNIATGGGISGNTKVLNLGTGYGFGGTTTVNIGSSTLTSINTINLNGNVVVSGTVNGVDVDELKYSDTNYFSLRDAYTEHLSTTYKNIPLYNYIFDKATPMATVRILDLTAEVNWLDTIYNSSEYQNDLQVQCTLVVPSGTTNAVSLGSVTPTSGGGYVVGSSYHGWYFVSGDVTHYFNDFGRIHENSGGGMFERTLYAYQYDTDQDRTYFSISTYPSGYSTGTTLYWHPYAWESAGTLLNDWRYADEKGRSGQEPLNFRWKTAYDDRSLKYQLKIKELSASSTQPDRAQIGQSMLKITRQEP